MGLLQDSDLKAVVLKVFTAYLAVCRHLQRTYWLEPAGSHGVWSLDDYQMLVFYIGACQYMYFEAIHYINTVGNGSCR